MDLTEKPIKQDYIYKGKIINVRVDDALLPDGGTAKREIVEHPGGVCVAALTDENELLFVEQFRYPYFELVLELPAGKLEYGEDPFEAGKRELREETGAVASHYEDLGKLYPPPAIAVKLFICIWRRNSASESRRLTRTNFLSLKEFR